MPRKRKVHVKCPTCKQNVALGSEDFPFCSERCRLIDLGNWSSEKYKISEPVFDESEFDESIPDELPPSSRRDANECKN